MKRSINRLHGYERTRWEVERERCQIADPFPQPKFKEAEQPAPYLDKILKRLDINYSTAEARIQNDWIQIVGPDLARHATPGNLTQKTLTVYVMGSTWLAELKRNQGRTLIQKINAVLGPDTVQRISFRAAPIGYQK